MKGRPGKNMNLNLNRKDKFENRHLGSSGEAMDRMLELIGVASIDELMDQTIPQGIRLNKELNLPDALTEYEFLNELRTIASKNKIFKSYIGMGYYPCITPPVIRRNIFENPGWYTAYTPYQAEISQGRLEALINFQTVVTDLTGMEIANASLLDEGTAAAEAMNMLHALRKGDKKNAVTYWVDENIFPQTLAVLRTRAIPAGINLVAGDLNKIDLSDPAIFGVLLQYPDGNGKVEDHSAFIQRAKEKNIFVAFTADLLSLTLLKSPGELGVDVVTGSTQRFGIPMGYGGPHAAFFATREEYKRQMPGRIIGVSVDALGKKAYRMALQTREQHIRREKATSNICTSQVLLAVMAGMYAVHHGPEGLRSMAERIHGLASLLSSVLTDLGLEQLNTHFFDTLKVKLRTREIETIKKLAEEAGCNFRYFEEDYAGISLDETTSIEDISRIAGIFAAARNRNWQDDLNELSENLESGIPDSLMRSGDYLSHPVFHSYHSEHEMMRYIKSLENKDLSLAHSMISLGSCTMKLNAAAEMIPVSWPEFSNLHPFAPVSQAAGYQEIFRELESWLNEITGCAGTTLQPNSGAQGEFTGLMVIRGYHQSRGQGHRNITLIPSSAHGTNPASAVMAGMEVVIVQCDDQGNIDVNDLRSKAALHQDNLAALMVTYPSTHGVFEEKIGEICEIIHQYGGQVYMDGANMNAQVGLTSPAAIGADICHLNLHKTFCIPHGGGGPGVGPVCAAAHLKPFLPGNPVIKTGGDKAIEAVASAPWGSAGILVISYAYIRMMGPGGLAHATRTAILNANYIVERLKKDFKILYTGTQGRVGHEFILDCRDFRQAGVEVEDIAKRMMDYGFHAPTVSFPVHGTLMIEPTESESREELDRFCDALLEIRKEIREIEEGKAGESDNVLKNAPHTAEALISGNWNHPYSREKAAFPLPYVKARKFWPSVSRIDNAYGDRNLFCTCIPVEEYEKSKENTLDKKIGISMKSE